MRRRKHLGRLGLVFLIVLGLGFNSIRVLAEESPVNLAANKPVTASSMSDLAHAPAYGSDGDINTLWIAWGGDAGNWWQVDLGQPCRLTGSELNFENSGHPWRYQIQISLDQTAWTTVADYNTSTDTSQAQTHSFTATARYVRVLFEQAPDLLWTAFREFQVFGTVMQENENIALGKSAAAGSIADAVHGPAYGNDGNLNSMWIAWGGDEGNWWQVDLGQNYELIGSELTFENSGHPWRYQVQASTDQINWATVADYSNGTDTAQVHIHSYTATARYVRLIFAQAPDSLWTAFQEFKVFGTVAAKEENIAVGKSSIAGSIADEAHAAPYGNDGETDTLWIADGSETGNWWQVDLGQLYAVTGSELTFETSGSTWNYQIQASTDQTNWVTAADCTANAETEQVQKHSFSANARYIRILFGAAPADLWVAFAEFKVFADETVKFLPAPTGLTATATGQNQVTVTWEPSVNAVGYDLWVDGTVIHDAASPYQHTGLSANSAHGYRVSAVNENGAGEFSTPVTAITPIAAQTTEGKRVMILVPHPDDEVIIAAGIMEDALSKGYPVKVVIATNGDCSATSQQTGRNRLLESISALQYLGLSMDNIIALGYGDVGADNAFLSQLYQATDDTQVIVSTVGSMTYGVPGVLEDYHYQLTSSHGSYNKGTFLYDLEAAINSFHPTDIYTTSIYDTHEDHSCLNLFARDVIRSIKQQDTAFSPMLHEAVVHSTPEDIDWPGLESDPEPILSQTRPQVLDNSILVWDEREVVTVPRDMLLVPRTFNRKQGALERYDSQFGSLIAPYVKRDEVFWKTDFSNLALTATVTASSESITAGKTAVKAADGTAEGSPRFPGKEWATQGETTGAWIQFIWAQAQPVTTIRLYDRPNAADNIAGATLTFSDGSSVEVGALPPDGRPLTVIVPTRAVTWVRLIVNNATGSNIGLSEFEVFS